MSFESIIRKSKKLLIIGGYGTKNYGDEAILAGILDTIRKINSSVKMEVIAHDPKQIKKLHQRKGRTITELFPHILTYDTILIGGGTIFRKGMRLRAQLSPLAAVLLKFCGKKILFYSLGIDKNTSPFAKFWLVRAMNAANFVSVRDEDSKKILQQWGVKKKIHLVSDPGESLSYTHATDEQLRALSIDPKRKCIGLSLRNIKKENDIPFMNDLTILLKELLAKKYQILFIPFCRSPFSRYENDTYIGLQLKEKLQHRNFILLNQELAPRDLKGLIARMDAVIAMRLHAMIFAVSTNTQLIGISYSQKCASYLNAKHQRVFSAQSINCKEIKELLLQHKNR